MDFSGLFARNIHPEIAGLARYTGALAGQAHLPRRSEFKLANLGPTADYVFLIDMLPNDYHYVASGKRIAFLYGADLQGKRVSEISNAVLRQSLKKTYDRVVATHLPLYMRGRYVWTDRSIPIERLLIPMADNDGQMNAICGIAIPDVAADDLTLSVGHTAAQLVGNDELVLNAA